VYNLSPFTDGIIATTRFFEAYPRAVGSDIFRRLLTAILNCAKSTNALVRAGSVGLFKVLIQKNSIDSNSELAIGELLALPKAGKTAGPDHRIALYSMLSALTPSLSISPLVASTVPQLVGKETHDGTITILAATLPSHISFLLQADKPIPVDITSLLAKEMNNAKPVVRRTFCLLVGNIFWTMGYPASEASVAFTHAILPSLETNLKTVVANPLTATAGPLEGYIAMAVLLGPISRSGKFGTLLSCFVVSSSLTGLFMAESLVMGNTVIQSLASVSAKPTFLFWDKVYQKLTDTDDEIWLLRASDSALVYLKADLAKNEHLRHVFCSFWNGLSFTILLLIVFK
jgi:hypothetical protein